VHSIYDQSAIHILEQIAREVQKLKAEIGKHFFLIAEYDLDSSRIVQNFDIGGFGFNAQWNDNFHHSLHSILTGETNGYYADFGKISHLAKCLKKVFAYDGIYSQCRKAIHGRPAIHCDGSNFIGYIQNHDQVGNRAAGERISHLVNIEKAKIAAAIIFTSPFVPMIFAGEEFAASTPFQYFTDVSDSKLAKGITEGRKNEFAAFGWDPARIPDPQSPGTFENSKLNWQEVETQPHYSMLEWYRKLIHIRKNIPDLRSGSLDNIEVNFDDEQKWIDIQRAKTRIIANFGDACCRLDKKNSSRIILGSDKRVEFTGSRIEMPSNSVGIFL
jgi:maltooligosyltrehalose trehalohydrolase